jgi:hypothetical protein
MRTPRFSFLAGLIFLATPAWAITEPTARALQAEIRAMVPVFNSRTGLSLDATRVHVHFDGMPLSGDLAGEPGRVNDPELDLYATSNAVSMTSGGNWRDDPAGGDCLIVFSRAGSTLTGVTRTSILAHELFHCYQHHAAAPTGLTGVGRWIIEGQAEWAGEMHANDAGRADRWFAIFLNSGSLSLYDRDYDAMPFFAHVFNRVGVNLWRRLLDMVRVRENAPAFLQAIPSTDLATLQTWPMGLWQDDSKGPDWTTVMPGAPEVLVEYPRETLRAGDTREFDAATPQHFTVSLRENKLYRVRLQGAQGGLSSDTVAGAVVDERLTEGVSRLFCFSSEFDCRCPGGGEPLETFTQLGRDTLDVAVTAGASGTGRIEIEEFEPTCCGSPGALPPEWVGTWMLDVSAYAELALGPTSSTCSTEGEGSQTMLIRSDGGVSRTTAVTTRQTCVVSGMTRTTSERTEGNSTMCMRVGTTAGGPTAFYRVLSDTHYTTVTGPDGRTSQPYNRGGPAEPPSLAPYVGTWGDPSRELRGSYFLMGDELILRNDSSGLSTGARRYVRSSR